MACKAMPRLGAMPFRLSAPIPSASLRPCLYTQAAVSPARPACHSLSTILPAMACPQQHPRKSSTICRAAAAFPVVVASGVAATPAATGLAAGATTIAATVMGYLVLVGACFRSVPQISRIWKEQSVEGLSVTAFMTELVCFTVTIAYNVHQTSTVFVFAFGNSLNQIMLNRKRGNSGVLSGATVGLNVAGNAVRVFTTLVLTKDLIILFGFSLQLILNSILLYQCVQTAKNTPTEEPPADVKAKAE
eukprot:gene10350-8286_t